MALVQEVRSILLSAEESRAAIMQFMVMKLPSHQPSQVTRVELQEAETCALVTVQADRRITQHTLDMTELMSALLLFCRKANIPLSTRAHKRLSIAADCITLTASINLPSGASDSGSQTGRPASPGRKLSPLHTT